MRQMHIRERNVPELCDLRHTRRHATRHRGNRQAQRIGRRQRTGAPHSQAIDAAIQGLVKKLSAYNRRQCRQLLGRFLQEQKIRKMPFDKRGHVFDARTGQTQQVPAYDFQISDSRLALLSSLDLILSEWHAN